MAWQKQRPSAAVPSYRREAAVGVWTMARGWGLFYRRSHESNAEPGGACQGKA
jgi:hypothetical protein